MLLGAFENSTLLKYNLRAINCSHLKWTIPSAPKFPCVPFGASIMGPVGTYVITDLLPASEFAFSRILYKWNHTVMDPLVSGFFHLA